MPLLAVTNLHVTIGGEVVLDGTSLSIEEGERIGLVGRNGAGKSTLMRAITGEVRVDSGQVSLARGRRAGYLAQDPTFGAGETLRGEAEAAFAELHELHRKLEHVFEELAKEENSKEPRLSKLLAEQERLEKAMEASGGYSVGHRIDAVLHGLGFGEAEFQLPVKGLSGGQRARLALAKLLLEGPDLLLLDEPTNHLDITGRLWLEDFLTQEYKGSVLMVTHDRAMLDRVVNRIVEVEQGRLIDYPGSYEEFLEMRHRRRLTQQRAFEKQQTKFKQEEAFIRRYKAGQRAKQAQGRQTRLERAKESSTLERPMELAVLSMELPKAPRTGDLVVTVRGACKSYRQEDGSERVLFRGLDLTIGRGERWGIIGPNGVGKTTLVRAMLGEIPIDAGTIRLGSNVVVGHFRQVAEESGSDLPVYRYLQDAIRRENGEVATSEQFARNLAGAFLFSGSDQEKEMRVLSGGERARARLAALLACGKNVLVLDEPTNHLDIPSAERLEDALASPEEGGTYDGTLILISHDRALIDATCDHLAVFHGDGRVETFVGNYSEWVEFQARRDREAKAKEEARRQAHQAQAAPKAKKDHPASGTSKNPFSWMKMEEVEKRLEESTAKLKELDAVLGDPEVYLDRARCQRAIEERDTMKARVDELEAEWLRRAEA